MSGTQEIAVFVAHEDPVLAAGLKAVLGGCPGFRIVGPGTGDFQAADSPAVDIVVADYRCGMDWLERKKARRGLPTVRVVILTALAGESEVRAALAAGVSGYVLQGCDIDELRQATLTAARGARYMAPSVAQRLADSLAHAALTAREIGVLSLIAAGMCNKTIARELQISLGTVKTHVSSILEKLCASSRTQAVSRASERGLIAPVVPRRPEAGFSLPQFSFSHLGGAAPSFA